MTNASRRDALSLGLIATAAASLPASALAASGSACKAGGTALPNSTVKAPDGQRRASLADGRYINPVLAGDHADPSILKDGDTYYKVSSSYHYYPGLVIWKSTDLVNWLPVGPALTKPIGSVLAPDIVKHGGRHFIYFPVANFEPATALPPSSPAAAKPPIANMVVHADAIEGPWSDPIDMEIYDGIDPGHVIGEDGKRYLFLSDGKLVPITDDGLKRAGKTEKVYDGWPIPNDWVIEGFALESPKLVWRNGWLYMFSAQGGTAGPATGHMVTVARSKSVRGPWVNCPHNPIVRTESVDEPFWSRGHATAIEGPAGDWWLVYHAYENGFRTLGRHMLLEPFEWTSDGWPRVAARDLSKPIKASKGKGQAHGIAVSKSFSPDKFGPAWAFHKPGTDYRNRIEFGDAAVILSGEGTSPDATSPLVVNVGDHAYEVAIEIEMDAGTEAGLLIYYNQQYFSGVGCDGRRLLRYQHGKEFSYGFPVVEIGRKLGLRLVNDRNQVTFAYRTSAGAWTNYSSFEVSGYNQNIGGGFLSLRPALYATGNGKAAFRDLHYAALS